MLNAWRVEDGKLLAIDPRGDLAQADWIDLYRPMSEQSETVEHLGIPVPSLAEMEEIEISNRLYIEGRRYHMTVVLTGETPEGEDIVAPVTFILTDERLVTVRHHAPRPFSSFPDRADRGQAGINSPERLLLSLLDEIIARQADLLEAIGQAIDWATANVLEGEGRNRAHTLRRSLEHIGRQGDSLARSRLSLLSIERMLSFLVTVQNKSISSLKPVVKAHFRDIQALEVHTDFLGGRVSLAVDATLGLITLEQNDSVRIMSVIAALFLPPTLIASIYGMNFARMPELQTAWGYPAALAAMAASAFATYLFLKWRGWL